MSNPTCEATNCGNILTAQLTETHGASCSIALINCRNFTGDIGSELSLAFGYDGSNTTKFTGYVKEIQRNVPDNTYSITAYDKMIRAVDFAIVSSDPTTPFSRENITLEDLIRDILLEAGLSSFDFGSTHFTVATLAPVEIDLQMAYDYAKSLADLMAWGLWCDKDGIIHFKNRKPFVMDGSTGEIGDVADTIVATITTSSIINASKTVSEKNLRNRVVVRGEGVTAEAKEESTYLPPGFYKTAVLGAPQLIDDQSIAQECANINLNAFKHITETVDCTVEGTVNLNARTAVHVEETNLAIDNNYYIYSNVINFTKQGFLNQLNLRRII
jgi:hypothetical protein